MSGTPSVSQVRSSAVASLLLVVVVTALTGCGMRHQTVLPRSADPLLPPEHYLNAKDYSRAHRAALRRLESARGRGDHEAETAAELLLAEAMLGMNDHLGAQPLLVRATTLGTERQKSEASALLAYSHHRRLNDPLAKTYFAQVDQHQCDPRIWRQVCSRLGKAASPPRSAPTLDIIPRRAWARSSFRPGQANAMGRISRVTVHHTGVVTPAGQSRAAAADRLRSIQRSHFSRGWAGVGYHYLIDSSGRVWEARPIRYQGAHAGSSSLNRGNVGISLMGDFSRQKVPSVQRRSLEALIGWLMDRYRVAPHSVKGHGDLKHTQCPGAHLSHMLPAIVKAAQRKPTWHGAGGSSGYVTRRSASRSAIRRTDARRRYHTVIRGDTLSRIARSYGVSLGALRRANPGAADLLYPGRLIALP